MPEFLEMCGQIVNPAFEILNSWKDIARYMDRGVRTVQRWEIDLHLPVHRPHGRRRSAVFAIRAELDRWIRSCPTDTSRHMRAEPAPSGLFSSPHPRSLATEGTARLKVDHGARAVLSTSELIFESEQIRRSTSDSRVQLRAAILRLRQTIGKMRIAGS